jgi:hypothetical protein
MVQDLVEVPASNGQLDAELLQGLGRSRFDDECIAAVGVAPPSARRSAPRLPISWSVTSERRVEMSFGLLTSSATRRSRTVR